MPSSSSSSLPNLPSRHKLDETDTMRQYYLFAITFAILATSLNSIAMAEDIAEITNQETKWDRSMKGGDRYLRKRKETSEGKDGPPNAQDEERMVEISGLSRLSGVFQKNSVALEKNVAQVSSLKKSSALVTSLERNPSMVKDLSTKLNQNPGLIKGLMKSPAFNKLQSVFSRNPSQKRNVEKIGAMVSKRGLGRGTMNPKVLFGLGILALLVVGGVSTGVTLALLHQ